MELELIRDIFSSTFCLGLFYQDGMKIGFSCEDTLRGDGYPATVAKWKIPKTTAIPYGRYQVIASFSNRFQKILPEILDVPGFSGIRIHGGNDHEDTEGCPLLGISRIPGGVANCAPVITALTESLLELAKSNKKCYLTIRPYVQKTLRAD